MVWYLNFKDNFIIIPLECKSSQLDLDLNEIKTKAKKIKEKFGLKRLIIVINKKILDINEDFVLIPIEILLLLM